MPHQHAALPETGQRTGCIMRALEGYGAEERGAVCETVPVVVPLGAESLGGHRVAWHSGIAWLGDLEGIELVDVFMGGSDGGTAELDGVLASEWEMRWDADGVHLQAGDVDELGGDGSEGHCDGDAGDAIQVQGGCIKAVARVGTVEGGDGVGRLRRMPRKREREVDIGCERGRVLGRR